jgi:tRNA 2-thiouridine synthesizing protein E
MELVVNGQVLARNEQGFLRDRQCWNVDVAEALAREADIELSAAHWEILYFMRDYYNQYKHLPNSRVFVKAIRNQFGEEKGSSRYLQQLFPDGPLKFTCKLAGLPKPPTCL